MAGSFRVGGFVKVESNTKAGKGQLFDVKLPRIKPMHNLFNRLRKLGAFKEAERLEPALRRSCLGRLAGISTFLVIILCLVAWVIVFLSLQRSSAQQSIPANILPQAMCVAFFGGLVFVALVGGLLGNILRRILWRILQRKDK